RKSSGRLARKPGATADARVKRDAGRTQRGPFLRNRGAFPFLSFGRPSAATLHWRASPGRPTAPFFHATWPPHNARASGRLIRDECHRHSRAVPVRGAAAARKVRPERILVLIRHRYTGDNGERDRDGMPL